MHLFLNPINYCKYNQSRKEIFFGTFTLGTGRTFEGWLEGLAGLEEDAMEDEAALGSANTLAKGTALGTEVGFYLLACSCLLAGDNLDTDEI